MQFSSILPVAFCLVASTFASPIVGRHAPGAGCAAASGAASTGASTQAAGNAASAAAQANVTATIGQWSNDIDGVNSFVDGVVKCTGGEAMAKSMAQTALGFAQNEGASLDILKLVPGLDASGAAAVAALPNLFKGIGGSIQAIIDDPSAASVTSNVDNINNLRCQTAINDEGAVWAAAAAAVGATAPAPNKPAACDNIAALN